MADAAPAQPETLDVDWNDFAVVDTVQFEGEDGDSPADGSAASSSASSYAPATLPPPPPEKAPTGVKIRQNYTPVTKKHDQLTIKCRVCGNMIPANQINEHLQIELLDPKYVELKEEYEARGLGKNLAQGRDIAANLELIAIRRPDIFGESDVYADRLKRENEQIAQQHATLQIWDGQMKGMSRTSANIAMMQNQQRKQQIAFSHSDGPGGNSRSGYGKNY